jgi:hypothetical protein
LILGACLIQQNSDALIHSASCRWARRGVHAGGVVGAGLPVTCPALMSPADPVGFARFGALTRRALRNRYSLVGQSAQGCSASGYCCSATAGYSFMAVSPVVRSLGRQWPPLKLHWNVGPHHFLQSTSGYSPQSDCSGDAFFMTRRHSDAASFEVIGLESYGKSSNAPTSSQVGRSDAGVSRLRGWRPHPAAHSLNGQK